MWHFIGEQISLEIGSEFNCNDIKQIQGANSHQAFVVNDDKQSFFVKINEKTHLAHFAGEQVGLEHLQQTGIFRIPKVICSSVVGKHSFLVLEYIAFSSGEAKAWFDFGQKLAILHQEHTQEMYGWQEDNFIGLSPQPNQWHKKWPDFFAEQRIGFMLQLLAEKGHVLADINNTVASVKRLLHGHQPVASMLHGDLWQGNTGFCQGEAVLFDPAFYYGDRETDLAMTELFSRFPEDFYLGYNQKWPLAPEYNYRKPIYQLYHVLNHALLFGEQYLNSAKHLLDTLDS